MRRMRSLRNWPVPLIIRRPTMKNKRKSNRQVMIMMMVVMSRKSRNKMVLSKIKSAHHPCHRTLPSLPLRSFSSRCSSNSRASCCESAKLLAGPAKSTMKQSKSPFSTSSTSLLLNRRKMPSTSPTQTLLPFRNSHSLVPRSMPNSSATSKNSESSLW